MSTTISEVDNDSNFSATLGIGDKKKPTLLKPTKVSGEIISELNGIQKTLLITDGTVTELLEHYLGEPIKVEKIREIFDADINNIPKKHKQFISEEKTSILLREVLLRGNSTSIPCLHAESSVLINRLPDKFRGDLIGSDTPIGNLWSKYRFETYKTDFVIQKEKANEHLAEHLNVPVGSNIFSRTYCVYSQGKVTMIITENFSDKLFVK